MKIKSIAIAASVAAVFSPIAALAGSYEAFCGDVECTINVSTIGISTPQGSIPPSRVSYWSVNGKSSTKVGVGVATTILFGPLGLLGFMAKKHDYNFTIDGYDAEGRRVALLFKFKKEEPAKYITEELFRISGLPMGRQRSIAEIKAIESGESPLNAMAGVVEPALGSATKTRNCDRMLKDYDCNYSAYLEANPSVKVWAEENPEMAAKERIRLGAYTDEEIEEKAKAKVNSLGAMDSGLEKMDGFVPPSSGYAGSTMETPYSSTPVKKKKKKRCTYQDKIAGWC